MKEYEIKPVTRHEKEIIKITCDQCKVEINKENGFETYFEVSTHHNHWGNDSGDSYEYEEMCSIECLTIHMRDYYTDTESGLFYEVETMDVDL